MIRAAWILASKDVKVFFRDRGGMLLNLLLPIALSTIFAVAMGAMGGSGGTSRIKLFVEDLDKSESSRALIAELAKSRALKIEEKDGVRARVADGGAAAALLIPAGYADDLLDGDAPSLKLYQDPGKAIEQQIVAASLLPVLFKTSGREALRTRLGRMGVPSASFDSGASFFDRAFESIEDLGDGIGESKTAPDGGTRTPADDAVDGKESMSRLLGLQVEKVAGGAGASRKTAMQSQAITGTAVMMLLFGLAACGGTLLEERADGTLQRLLLSPATPGAVLLGKCLATGIMGAVQLAVLYMYGALVFRLQVWNEPLALAVHSLAVIAACTGLGVLLAVVCRTRKQLEGLSTLLILVMSALGGSWFPLIATPEWFQKLGHVTLNAWAMDGYQDIFWYGKGLGGVWVEDLVLASIAAVTLFVATRMWNTRSQT